jgi:hypothetical protein
MKAAWRGKLSEYAGLAVFSHAMGSDRSHPWLVVLSLANSAFLSRGWALVGEPYRCSCGQRVASVHNANSKLCKLSIALIKWKDWLA